MRIEIGLVKKLALALALAVSASFSANLEPFQFIGAASGHDAQQKEWNRLLKYKLWGTGADGEYGVAFVGQKVFVTDSSGYSGSAKGYLRMSNTHHTIGGPLSFGGGFYQVANGEDGTPKDEFSSGDGNDSISTGPSHFGKDFYVSFNARDKMYIAGNLCVEGKATRVEQGLANGHGNSTCSAKDIPEIDATLDVPTVNYAMAGFAFNREVASINVVGTTYIDIPEGDGVYDLHVTGDIKFENNAALYVRMPAGGRLTRIFLDGRFDINSTQHNIGVMYATEDATWGGSSWSKAELIENKKYAGNLLFYSPQDISFPTEECNIQGTFISGGEIFFKQHYKFAGQLLAKRIKIDAEFRAQDFIYVPFDPPTFKHEANSWGRLKEGVSGPQELSVSLTKKPETQVTFKYCYIFKGDKDASIENAADTLASEEDLVATSNLYLCSKGQYGEAKFNAKDSLLATAITLTVNDDALVENEEHFTIYVYDLRGAVSDTAKQETFSGYFDISIIDNDDLLTGKDGSVTATEDVPYVFEKSDFPVFTHDGDVYTGDFSIRIVSKQEDITAFSLDGKPVDLTRDIPSAEILEAKWFGGLTYTPPKDQYGDKLDSIEYYIVRGSNKSETTYKMYVNVSPVNDAPSFDSTQFTIGELAKVGDEATGTIKVTDVDDKAFSYAFDSGDKNYAKVSELFKIDSETGVITVEKAALNYESADSIFVIGVIVKDSSKSTGNYADADSVIKNITIRLIDENEKPEIAEQGFPVEENSPKGTVVGTVVATEHDRPTVPFGQMEFYISETENVPFAVSTSGVITVTDASKLDFEKVKSFTFYVVVKDKGDPALKDSAKVTINLIDVNEPPEFIDDGEDHYDVDEHSKKGLEVARLAFVDRDGADVKASDFVPTLIQNSTTAAGKVTANDLYDLTIEKDSESDTLFYVVISVKDSAKLNYEDLAKTKEAVVAYDVTISIKDQAGVKGANEIKIDRKLVVNDVNEAPTAEDFAKTIKENVKPGTEVGTIVASDLDTKNDKFGTLKFTIVDEGVPFTVDNNGLIKVASDAVLNYEKKSSYEFDVEVTDGVAAPVISHVVITLENVNEDPKISCLEDDKNCEGPFSIAENSATGTVIHSFGVVDEDKDSKFALSSVVLSDTNKTGADTLFGVKFNSDKSQISIYVLNKSRLDYEKINASYTVSIKVSDAAGASDTIIRVINVIDVNEKPVIDDLDKDIPENQPVGAVVATMSTTEPDTKNVEFRHLEYSIITKNVPFVMDSNKVKVSDASAIDFETNPKFTFKVEVKNCLKNSTTGKYTESCLADTADVVLTLTDEEEPPEIIPDPECDEDKEDCCDPNLTSCDDPTPPDTNCVTNCGYKTGDTLYVNVRENSKTGTQILKYYVKDQDAGDLVSMKVYFEDVYKSGADSLFVVSPTLTKDTKGNYYFTLTVKDGSKLDFEKVNEKHVLRIITKDDGGKADSIVRVINVVDLNEKPVVADISKDIKENLPNGTVVDTVKATDPDIKNKAFSTLSYSILGADTVPFVLDTKNPTLIKVKDRSKLNYEVNPKFTFYVQVTDGTLSDTAKITLTLSDVDEPPEIIPDPECDETKEDCCDPNLDSCDDPNPPDPTCVTNCGYIKGDTMYVNVRENSATGTQILKYYVKDEDVGDLASMKVSFEDKIKSGADSLFAVSPTLTKDTKGNYYFTLTVKDKAKLDYEKVAESHRIVITVKDDAGLTDTIIRVIKVVDVNEPLTVKNANFNVDENSANGTVVGKMSASDQDTKHPEIFAVLKYSIIEEGTPFKMDSNKVRVADGSRLNYEKDSLYTIHVRVTDGEFSDTALVKIKLNNTNEEPFIKCLEGDTNCDGPYDVEENTPTNTVIHTFAVMDDDKDPAFRLNSATIIDTKGSGAEKLFGIKFNKDSSQVTVFVKDGSLLDYEKIYPSYTVKIKIKDAMQVADSIIRVINVIDVDEAPTLEDAKFTIAENTPNGTILGSLLATDPDSKNVLFRTLSYEILDDVPFKMDSNKVVVSDVSRLNYEKVTEFYFDVRVTDGGGLSAVATVYVKLTDEEEPPEIIPEPECDPTKEVCHECDATIEDCDNKEKIPDPTCTENCGYLKNDTLYVNVRENSATGSKILEYYVKDEDAGDLQSMEVSFKDLNKSGSDSLFSVTPALVKDSKGYKFILTVADSEKLDYEKVNHVHKILITVKDDAGLTDTVVRVINVVDVNEPPYIVKAEFDLDEHKPAGFVVGTIEWGDDKDKDGVSNPAFRDNRVVAVGGATEIFDVDSMGVITVKKRLNYETDDTTYTLQVSVEDKNDPSLSSTEVMTIHLKNIKETPIITSTEFTIPENPSDKDVVGTLTSEDPDDLDDKEKRTYTLIGTSPYVKVSEDGKIIVTNKEMFDFEKVESFTIKVKVTDPQNVSSDTVVTIKITDENEAPTLDDKVIKVSEDSKPNIVIDTLKAKDPDSKNKDFRDLTYTIVSGDTSLFEVDPKTGEVILKDSLDYEKKKEYILKVEVSDGEFADTAKVTVAVQNVIERSEVVIEKVQDADSLWVRPDSVFTNHPNMTICWTEDGDEICTDTTMTEGIHTIIKKFQDPKKDFAGADTVVIHISTSAPKVIISADGSDRGYGDIFNIDEVVDEKDTSIYVNNPKNDIRVTIKDPVKKDSSFVVKLDLETVNVSKKDLETISTVVDKGNFKLDEKPENAVRTPVNGSEIKVAYTEKVNGKEVQITYYTDNDSNVILTPVINEKGEIDSVEVITVSYVTKIGGREVTVSYQADGVTGQVLNVGADGTLTYDDKIVVPSTPVGKPSSSSSSDKDSSKTATTELSVGSYKVTYEYEDDNHNTVVVTYTIDEKGNIVKNAEGDIGYTVSYTYENKFGNAATQSVFIVLDQSKPVVEILYPTPMQVIRSNSVEVKWTINGVLQDTLTVQGLSKGYNSITRTYHDKAGNMDSVTIGVFMKDGKDVDLSVEVPVVQMDREKVEEYYASNPPKKGQTASVSLKNPDSENEVEALTIGSYGQKDGSFKSPYPGVSGDSHLGPTVVMDIRLPTVSDVGGLATFDDIVLKDGTISSRGIDADGCYARDEFMSMTGLSEKELIERDSCVKYTVEEYVEKFCDPDEEIDVTGDLSKINLYNTKMHTKVWIYTSLGGFVDYYSFKIDLNDPEYTNKAGLLQMYFEQKPDRDGEIHTDDGRILATGAYLYKVESDIKAKLRCSIPPFNVKKGSPKKYTDPAIKKSEEMLKPFGYKRPTSK